MADQPDPPDQWRVYKGDDTPDPEPPAEGEPPLVAYGAARPSTPPIVVRTSRSGPRLILLMIAVAALGGVAAAAIAIFSAVDSGVGGIGGIGGIDAKDPDDFAELVDRLEEERGTTKVQRVGFYTDYIIVYTAYTDDPGDDRQISYTWRGGGLEEWTKGTSTDPRFDLREIDPDVIDGMCDPVLAEVEGTTPDDCYVFLSQPSEGSQTWFRASATDEFGRSYWVNYDKDGQEVDRGHS